MYEPFSKAIARGLVSLSAYIHPKIGVILKILRPEKLKASIDSTSLKMRQYYSAFSTQLCANLEYKPRYVQDLSLLRCKVSNKVGWTGVPA